MERTLDITVRFTAHTSTHEAVLNTLVEIASNEISLGECWVGKRVSVARPEKDGSYSTVHAEMIAFKQVIE